MTNIIPDFFEIGASTFFFLMMVSAAIFCNHSAGAAVVALKEVEAASNPVVYASRPDQFDTTVSRQELIATMMHDLEYPIVVDGIYISPEKYSYINFNYAQISSGPFAVTYVYQTDGELSMIRYDKIE